MQDVPAMPDKLPEHWHKSSRCCSLSVQCDLCGLLYLEAPHMLAHTKVNKLYVCDICRMPRLNRATMKTHLQRSLTASEYDRLVYLPDFNAHPVFVSRKRKNNLRYFVNQIWFLLPEAKVMPALCCAYLCTTVCFLFASS